MTERIGITDDPPPAASVRTATGDKRTTPALEFLQVSYTRDEKLAIAENLARVGAEKERLEEKFEVQRLDYKHQLEALESSMRDLTRKIGRGAHWENVECLWILESPKRDEKTLVRLDTGEIVRVVPMQEHDFQDQLPAVFKDAQAKISPGDFKLDPPADKETKKPEPGAPIQ